MGRRGAAQRRRRGVRAGFGWRASPPRAPAAREQQPRLHVSLPPPKTHHLCSPATATPGYLRVAAALYAFAVALRDPTRCAQAYMLSFVCDELDGRFARRYNQCSTLGAGEWLGERGGWGGEGGGGLSLVVGGVGRCGSGRSATHPCPLTPPRRPPHSPSVLDMVTDRVATCCLLALLCVLYPWGVLPLLALLQLDIASHWFQMYATLAQGASTHKVRVCVGKECGGGG